MSQLPPPKRRRTSAVIEAAMVSMGEELQVLRFEHKVYFDGRRWVDNHWIREKQIDFEDNRRRTQVLKSKLEALQWVQGRRLTP